MFGWIARFILFIAGFITSWFVARDALNFEIIQMVVAVILFATVMLGPTLWKMMRERYNQNKKQ